MSVSGVQINMSAVWRETFTFTAFSSQSMSSIHSGGITMCRSGDPLRVSTMR